VARTPRLFEQNAGVHFALDIKGLVMRVASWLNALGNRYLALVFLLEDACLHAVQGTPDVLGAHGLLCQFDALLSMTD
jgi:hypothetical protein